MPEEESTLLPGQTQGASPPVGQEEPTSDRVDRARAPRRRRRRRRRPRPRSCHRKGCGHRYLPVRRNQRYCGDPACRRLLRRWQAAKRQRKRRATPDGRRRHRDEERERRRPREPHGDKPGRDRSQSSEPRRKQPRGHAGRYTRHGPICDRPGCWEPPRPSLRTKARYCGDECRRAVRRVVDRERKWRLRATTIGRRKRRDEYARARGRRARRGENGHVSCVTPGPSP